MTLPLHQAVWLGRTLPTKPNLRKQYVDIPSLDDAEQDLRTRIAILERGNSHANARLAEVLREGMRADTACCPVLCLRFRIWFVGAALAIHKSIAMKGEAYTLLSLDEAVDVGQLHTINWTRLHARLRKRLNRILGEDEVVVGMAKVEYDRTRNKWQPQYYLMIYGRSAALLEEFCRGYFWAKRTAPQLLIRPTVGKPAKWFSHMCKLTAFEEIMDTDGRSREVRLNDKLSREYFHYLADRSPSSFIFCINCNIVTQRVSRPPSDEDDDYDEGYQHREPSWPLPRARRKVSF